MVAWGANMFAALLQTYRADLTEAQVLGALGLIPALLVMARLSDRLGRRRVPVAALLLAGLGAAVILLAHGAFAAILTGRIIVGISAGAAFGPPPHGSRNCRTPPARPVTGPGEPRSR